jgi:polysaccharide transporter, PST family
MNPVNESPMKPVARLRPDTLAASVTILLVANVVQRTIGFGRGILFCRWLSPDELGTWEMAYSFLLLASPIIVLGLPGSFGRYLERFRQCGQLRTFLRRATIWTGLLTLAACALIVAAAPQFSDLIFGRASSTALIVLVTCSLAAIILQHYLESLFAALRKFSIVSTMQFFQSMLFAAISLGLLYFWRSTAASIVIGYGAACLIAAVSILVWNGKAVANEAAIDEPMAHREFWPPLLRFAFWVWVINFISHLFAVLDRYMLVHCSGLNNEAALALVGQYHASRIIPILFISVGDLLAGAVMPYLSHDWELGERRRVSDRLNTVLKLTSLVMLVGGVAVLWVSPLLFHIAFQGRYDQGLAVMPWALTYCVWYSMFVVAQNYIWCAEKTRLAALPWAAGLVLNIAVNLVLIPAWGLLGAAVSTTVTTGVALAVLYWLNYRVGMRPDRGMLLVTAAPIALCGGVWCGTFAALLLAIAVLRSEIVFAADERHAFITFGRQYWRRLAARWSQKTEQPEASHAI